MHPRTEVIHSGKVRVLDVTESLTYQGVPVVPGGGGSDEKAKVSANDTTSGFLNGKLVAGSNITLTENNDGSNETLTIAASTGGLTGFSASLKTSSVNNTIHVSALESTASSATADVALVPKNAGAFLASIPDAGIGGGAKRGLYAVDLQSNREANSHVAAANWSTLSGGYANGINSSATYATIVGGRANTINSSGTYATVSGGYVCIASGTMSLVGGFGCKTYGSHSGSLSGLQNEVNTNANYSVIAGGELNTVATASTHSFVGGGASNSTSSSYSTIAGGSGNGITSSRTFATIAGGQNNAVNSAGTHQFVGGGQLNTSSGTHACVVGGSSNTAYGNRSFIGSGASNSCGGDYSGVVSGSSHSNLGLYSTVVGGLSNTINSAVFYATTSGGYAVSSTDGMRSHASGRFAANGDCQWADYVLRCQTTNNTPTTLTADGAGSTASSANVSIPSDSTVTFDLIVTARRTDADNESASWHVRGCIDNNAGTTAFVGTPTVTVLGDDSAGAWVLNVTADDASDRLKIEATGQTSKTIRWGAHVRTMRISG